MTRWSGGISIRNVRAAGGRGSVPPQPLKWLGLWWNAARTEPRPPIDPPLLPIAGARPGAGPPALFHRLVASRLAVGVVVAAVAVLVGAVFPVAVGGGGSAVVAVVVIAVAVIA